MFSAYFTLGLNTLVSLYSDIFYASHLPQCRSLPSDASWPAADIWAAFNQSVDGRLVKTLPLGSPCHHPSYDEEQCQYLRANWRRPELHEADPASIMDPIFLNGSCDPFTAPEIPCDIGRYVHYAVNVSEPLHVIKTLNFVEKHNVRFVVKNTGHDYMGRSTAPGALSVWMHHLRDISFIDNFRSDTYEGPAVKAQAGVLGGEVTKAASERGLVGVSGACSTVGMVGGYIQGGGHSALSSMYGLGADQTLSFEVITPKDGLVVASPIENQDLYWALSGGGGGTYGIVWSATVKLHVDRPITVAILRFTPEGITQDAYWKGIASYLAHTPAFKAAKAMAFTVISPLEFVITPLFAVDRTVDEVKELLQPITSTLDNLNIEYLYLVNTYPTYAEAFASVPAFQLQNQDIANFQLANRLLPTSLWDDKKSAEEVLAALRAITDGGGFAMDVLAHPTLEVAGHPNNAVHPAWRDASHCVNVATPLFDGQDLQSIAQDGHKLTHDFLEPLRKLTPHGGSYLNEASPTEPDFKEAFFGTNYDKLLAIKDKYDPSQLLYGATNVGGDRWKEQGDGRLCRTQRRPWETEL